jgi:hypothetical protein
VDHCRLLAVAFLASGAMKLAQPRQKLAASGMGWAEDFTADTVKGIGALEVLAALGLILPPLLASRRFWCRWPPPAWCC